MAYQARHRDPLFDAETQALLERRGLELVGLVLMGFSGVLSLILLTYSPTDPSWLSATDAPVQNALGSFGAAIASPLFVILGLGAWAVALSMMIFRYPRSLAMEHLVFRSSFKQ